MNDELTFVENAQIIGEPARAKMLWNLMDGRAYTATELAAVADISRQSASNHLNKMMDAGLLIVKKQGKHRYYTFANDEVAYAIEALANLIPGFSVKKIKKKRTNKNDLFFARTCYDHLAGELAVKITSKLINDKYLIEDGEDFNLSRKGKKFFTDLGMNIDSLQTKKRILVKPCLDWTERKYHFAGSLGAEFLNLLMRKDWLRRVENSRKIILNPNGALNFEKYFGVKLLQ